MGFLVIKRMLGLLLVSVLFTSGIAFRNYTDINDVETLVESSPTNPRIIKIGEDLLKTELKINLLFSSIVKVPKMTLCQTFFTIERQLLTLKKKIADQKITKKHAIYRKSISHLTTFCDFLWDRMIELRVKNINIFEENCSPNFVFNAVINRRFQEAEDILKLIENGSIITWIVKEIYDSNIKNMKILLNFTESLSTIGVSISMISAIYKEIESSGQLDLFGGIDLLRILESDIFNQTNFDLNQHPNALSLHNDIVNFLKKNSTDMIVAEMLNHTLASDKRSTLLISELYNLNKILSTDIIFEVFDRVYGKITNNEIIDNIFHQTDILLVHDSLVYMYRKMKSLHQLNTGILKVAEYISVMRKMEYYKKGLKEKQHEQLISIWKELTPSIRSLFSAESVCLKNANTKEYLYADHFSYDNSRRNIFTWIPGTPVVEGIWHVEHQTGSTDFYFVNKEHPNEYMFASEVGVSTTNVYKHVFNCKLKGRVGSNKSAWNIEAVGKYLRIINVFNNQILCAAPNSYDDQRRYVITLQKEMFDLSETCMWEVEACH